MLCLCKELLLSMLFLATLLDVCFFNLQLSFHFNSTIIIAFSRETLYLVYQETTAIFRINKSANVASSSITYIRLAIQRGHSCVCANVNMYGQ